MSKKKMTGREILEEALRLSCSAYCDQYPLYEGEIDLGDDYERYINSLIKRSKNPFQRYFNTVGKCVAGIAAAILIVFSCSMTVEGVREPTLEFFANINEKFIEFWFKEDAVANAPNTIEAAYTLGCLPEGYELDDGFIYQHSAGVTWTNAQGDRLALLQSVLSGSTILDTDNSDYKMIERNNKEIACSEKCGMRTFFWIFDEYKFSLTMSSDISEEEALAMIDSLKKYNENR